MGVIKVDVGQFVFTWTLSIWTKDTTIRTLSWGLEKFIFKQWPTYHFYNNSMTFIVHIISSQYIHMMIVTSNNHVCLVREHSPLFSISLRVED